MHVCLYVYMYVCMYVCMYSWYLCMYVYTRYIWWYACMHACMYVCMFLCMYIYIVDMYVCMYVYTRYIWWYVCIYVCMYVCMYIYIYMYTYTHTHTYIHIRYMQWNYICSEIISINIYTEFTSLVFNISLSIFHYFFSFVIFFHISLSIFHYHTPSPSSVSHLFFYYYYTLCIFIPACAQYAIKRAAITFICICFSITILFLYLHAPNTPSSVPQGLQGAGKHVPSEMDLSAAFVAPRASTNSLKN